MREEDLKCNCRASNSLSRENKTSSCASQVYFRSRDDASNINFSTVVGVLLINGTLYGLTTNHATSRFRVWI